MDRIAKLAGFQWRAYWRGKKLKSSLAGPLILFGGLIVYRFLQLLPNLTHELSKGEVIGYKSILSLLFLIGIFVIMGEPRRSISEKYLLHFPLSFTELFVFRLISAFISPITFIWILGLLALTIPLCSSANPIAGIAALLLFICFSLFSAIALADLLKIRLLRRLGAGGIVVLAIAQGLLWLWDPSIPLDLWRTILSWSPAVLASRAAASSNPLLSIILLFVLAGIAAFLSFLTFRLRISSHDGPRSKSAWPLAAFVGARLKGGELVTKDVRRCFLSLDLYFAVIVALLFLLYLTSDDPSPNAVSIAVMFFFVPLSSIVFNCFGLDTQSGFDRYTIFPLSGRRIFLGKNLAFASIMFGFFGAMLPFVIWRLGFLAALIGFVELIVLGLIYIAVGNWMSLTRPFRMEPYRFASTDSIADAATAIVLCSLPGLATIYAMKDGIAPAALKIGALVPLSIGLYILSLSWSSKAFERRRERIRLAI